MNCERTSMSQATAFGKHSTAVLLNN